MKGGASIPFVVQAMSEAKKKKKGLTGIQYEEILPTEVHLTRTPQINHYRKRHDDYAKKHFPHLMELSRYIDGLLMVY